MPAPKGNQYAIGNRGGRPPAFKNPKALIKRIDQYFEYIQGEYDTKKVKKTDKNGKVTLGEVVECIREPEPATITGLVLFLGFASRQSLDDYAEKNEEFADIVARARTMVQYHYERRLVGRDTNGVQFALMNMGWKNKIETENTNKNLNLNVNAQLTPEKVRELEELKKKEF